MGASPFTQLALDYADVSVRADDYGGYPPFKTSLRLGQIRWSAYMGASPFSQLALDGRERKAMAADMEAVVREFRVLKLLEETGTLSEEGRVRYDQLGEIILDHFEVIEADLIPIGVSQNLEPNEEGWRDMTIVDALLLMRLGGLFSGKRIMGLPMYSYVYPEALGYSKVSGLLDEHHSMITFHFTTI